ncbi:MAG: DNA-binding protein [Saprospiraceae bacterium]|nr:DNA-binding protein [Saprospiraceae bacterium]
MAFRNASNEDIYNLLHQIADLLDIQDASPFRIQAYRRAAQEVSKFPEDLKELAKKKELKKIEAIPAIGHSIANIITDYTLAGYSRYLNRLKGEVSFENLIESIPGIGPALTKQIMKKLDIDTLEELEQAVHDGRLAKVPGIGSARVQLIEMALAGLLSKKDLSKNWMTRHQGTGIRKIPGVEILLDLDLTYREMAAAGQLKMIAPKRFNPTKAAWLPIYHVDRGPWHFTVLYSNTARAHQLGKEKDWVIIYFHKNGQEGQVTIVTETKGPLKGKRVVRGWEEESEKHYSLPFLLESVAD